MTKKYTSLEHAIRKVHINPQYKKINEDFEYEMAKNELRTAIDAAKRLMKHLEGEGDIEAWVQSKITKASDYLDTVADYMDSSTANKLKEELEETLDESLSILANKGNFRGTPPAMKNSVHIEPKRSDTHPTTRAFTVSQKRQNAKFATAEKNMHAEYYMLEKKIEKEDGNNDTWKNRFVNWLKNKPGEISKNIETTASGIPKNLQGGKAFATGAALDVLGRDKPVDPEEVKQKTKALLDVGAKLGGPHSPAARMGDVVRAYSAHQTAKAYEPHAQEAEKNIEECLVMTTLFM